MKILYTSSIISILSFFAPIFASQVLIKTDMGEHLSVNVQPEDNISKVKKDIFQQLGIPVEQQRLYFEGKRVHDDENVQDFLIKEFWLEHYCDETMLPKGEDYVRVYHAPLTEQEKADIRYIIITLANKSLTKLYQNKSHLDHVGDRIKPVHPLTFLEYVFTNDELIVGIRNIRKRGWVWDDFISGLKGSLKDELEKNNLQDEFIIEFANKIEIDISSIYPTIQNQQWVEFVDTLIKIVPRKGGGGRYDQ